MLDFHRRDRHTQSLVSLVGGSKSGHEPDLRPSEVDQDAVEQVEGVDPRQIDRLQQTNRDGIVGRFAQRGGDRIEGEGEVRPSPGDHLGCEPPAREGLNAFVDGLLGVGRIGVDVID